MSNTIVGNIKISYYKVENMTNVDLILFGKVDKTKINQTHVKVYDESDVEIPNDRHELLEHLFKKFNDPNNPLSNVESQEFIKQNRLHTSMSVGDIVEINVLGKVEIWSCGGFGWQKI